MKQEDVVTVDERSVAALNEIGDGLKTMGNGVVAIAGETVKQRHAVEALETKIAKLQATADEIKMSMDGARPEQPE